jgi:hypothetical protein
VSASSKQAWHQRCGSCLTCDSCPPHQLPIPVKYSNAKVVGCMGNVLNMAVQIQKAKADIGEHCSSGPPAGPGA